MPRFFAFLFLVAAGVACLNFAIGLDAPPDKLLLAFIGFCCAFFAGILEIK